MINSMRCTKYHEGEFEIYQLSVMSWPYDFPNSLFASFRQFFFLTLRLVRVEENPSSSYLFCYLNKRLF